MGAAPMGRSRFISEAIAKTCLLGLALGTFFSSAYGQAPANLEYRVKAEILYNIARFVEWPAGALAVGSPVTFCVLGADPFGPVLDDALRGKRIGNRPIVLNRYRELEQAGACQVLFIGASESGRVDQIIGNLGTRNTLTVSEAPHFAERGGMIDFILDRGRVRFEVNVSATERAGLRISSQVLELARMVKPRAEGRE